ncbi:unnamed protein product [Phytomonas sp. EM1]|nr:unnamed protein product [Phytomonas sp. EM1]|eukprot:CCW59526.1 unnamed protein product [Phytomonas sp. isolate EM1]
MSTYTLSSSRLKNILEYWKALSDSEDPTAQKCTAIFCIFGDITPSTLENQRSEALIQYLLDAKSPITNIALVLTASAVLVIVSEAISVQSPVIEGIQVSIVAKEAVQDALQDILKDATVAIAQKELAIQEGSFSSEIIQTFKMVAKDTVEAAPFIGELLFRKDDAALGSVEKAAGLCTAIFRRFVRPLIEEQISSTQPKTLGQLREEVCEKLEKPNTVQGLESLNVSEFVMAAALTPFVSRKGTYQSSIQVDAQQLQDLGQSAFSGDVVVVRYGTKCNSHIAFFGRTMMVESKAPADARASYEFVFNVSEKIIASLVPGVKLKEVYESVKEYAISLNDTLARYLNKSFGFSTGLLVLEVRGTISEKGTATVRNGMCFVVRVILDQVPDRNGGFYGMELADTVIIRDGVAELKTKAARKPSEILYEIEETAEETGEQATRNLSKITRQGMNDTAIVPREAQREDELKKLLLELHAEFIAAGGKKGAQTSTEELRVYEIGRLSFGELHPFSATDRVPPAEAKGNIYIQTDKKIAWLPLFGNLTPFHVCTISKVDVRMEGDRYIMVITFHTLQEANVGYKLNRTKVFLKELNYASSSDIFTEVKLQIQAVQQRIKNEDAARKRNATTAVTGKLVIGKILGLPQVKLRPPINIGRQNKGCVGNLELHQNGLRFSHLGGTPIDVTFDNIKHVIFQPSIQEICVIYHITLNKPIEVGRKNATELQFVAEVMESSEAATGTRRSHQEEIEAELRDENRARETNKQFITFARAVEGQSKIKTQLPISKFFFDGVHTRSMVKFRGSNEVLWAISDWPAFTQAVSEVEVVSFERVIPGGSTFDMTLVMKDYSKPVTTINSIPRQFLDILKDWCLSARLYYMETTVNPNWKVTLKDIRDDSEWDPWLPGAGWSVLNDEADEEDEETDSDSTYYEEEDEESDDSDESSWLEDEESDVPTEDEDSSDASWDELEQKAEEHDRKRHYSDNDEERPKKTRRNDANPPRAATVPPRHVPVKTNPFGKTAVPPPSRRF